MKIGNDIYYVGVNDHQVDLFEGQYVVPNGMSYNSYVIKDEKIAVMDTVDAGFTEEWLGKVAEVLDGAKPDYLVVQHMEPDHAANIENFMKAYPDTTVVANTKTFTMMENFFRGMDLEGKKHIVANGDTLTLGKHVLTFVFAPMVHWPEVMVTYDSTDKVLFSADGFGKFGALDVEEDWDCEARRYYIGIVGKYGPQVQKLLKAAATLDIQKICPLHGPVLTEDLGHYIGLYDTWSSYTPEAAKNDGKKNALIIWLHGAGEGGTDPRVALVGNKVVNLATDTVQQYFDGGAYVLAAQCPTMWMDNGSGQYTSDGTSKYTAALMELIKAYVNSNSDIDASRVYIGGCSNGGFMTMNMIVHYPKYFAAAYPVCEAYTNDALTDEMVESIKDMPIWFTHAKNDPTVKIGSIDEDGNFVSNGNYSPKAYERLTEAGGSDIHFSLFDDVHDTTGLYKRADGTPYQYNGHWSWLYTLNNECKENIDGEEVTIWQWISTKSKTNRGLEKVIAKVNALNAEDYTADSWAAVQSALAAAKAVAADQNATRTQINAAMEELVAAYSKLEYGVQKLHLEVAVEEAEKILAHPENYEDIAALKAALESGKAVLEDKDADQTAVDAAAEAILAELNKVADKADVKSLVNLIESAKKLLDGNYTSDSLKDLKAAIKKAEDVIANPNRTEAEIGTAYADLINAILNLQMKANKAALKAILDKANEVLGNADAYVAATIDGLDAAAAEAQTVYDNTDALQDDVDAAVRALTRKVADARLLGDVDNDGEVTTADSVALLAASAEITSLDADAAAAADVNGDGVADTNDAVLILQYAAEKVASF